MKKYWKKINSEILEDLRLFKVRVDTIQNVDSGATSKVTVLTGNDSCTVMAVTKDEQVVLVNNYRFGTASYMLELPGGMVDDGEDHQQSARRELLEETGYRAEKLIYAGCVASNPVFMDSFVHHYLAIGAEKVAEASLDEAEDIEVRLTPLEEVRRMLFNGEFEHPHSVSGVLRGLEILKYEMETS